MLKVWPCKLAVCCPVCIDVCFGLAVGQKCPNLLLPCARRSRAQSCGSPTFHSSLGHGSTVHVRDRSLENRQGSQPALTGAVLTSGQLGEDLRPSRIRFDCWLKAPMSTKMTPSWGTRRIFLSSQAREGDFSGGVAQDECLGTRGDFHFCCWTGSAQLGMHSANKQPGHHR